MADGSLRKRELTTLFIEGMVECGLTKKLSPTRAADPMMRKAHTSRIYNMPRFTGRSAFNALTTRTTFHTNQFLAFSPSRPTFYPAGTMASADSCPISPTLKAEPLHSQNECRTGTGLPG